jgi:hypothetical protein
MADKHHIPIDDVTDHVVVRDPRAAAVDPFLAKQRKDYDFTQTRLPASMNTIDHQHYGDSPNVGRQVWPLLPPFLANYDKGVFEQQMYGAKDLYNIVKQGLEGAGDQLWAGAEDLGRNLVERIGALFGHEPEQITTLEQLSEHLLETFGFHAYHFVGKPAPTLSHWIVDDAEFARQRLGGVNSTLIERYRGSTQQLDALIAELGSAVADRVRAAAVAQRLFIVDYRARMSCIEEVISGEYLAVDTIVLFTYEHDRLLPAAIQLEVDGPWFTPNDGFAWLLAKLHSTCAETQDQGMRAHLLCTHLLRETFAIATERAFSERHPLRLLLVPHLRYTITINELARKLMVDAGGNIDKVNSGGRIATFQQINFAYRRLRFMDLALPTDIAARGVDAQSLPCSYPYRDDALDMWAVMRELCASIVEVFYADDAALAADGELGFWIDELASNLNRGAFESPDWFDQEQMFLGHYERFPASIPTRAQLIDVLCNIVFGAAFQHAAVNNPQYDFFGYIPNGPLLLRQPPPRSRDVSAKDILDALPTRKQALFQLSFMHQLVTPSPNTMLRAEGDNCLYLLDLYGYRNPKAQAAIRAHAAKLEDARKQVVARGESRRQAFAAANPGLDPALAPNSVVYPYMDPTRVDNDIQI